MFVKFIKFVKFVKLVVPPLGEDVPPQYCGVGGGFTPNYDRATSPEGRIFL